MSHGGGNITAVVMRRPDGTPMTKQEVIRERRGAFKWLPVFCSNDLVHGSWWFVFGSLLSMVIAIVPLAKSRYIHDIQTDDHLPNLDKNITWSLLVICGFFYTVGSYAFVRAFEEPPQLPLFHNYKHFQTDELLGAWLFLLGTIPSVPWSLVYFSLYPGVTYFALLIMAFMAIIACALFVHACYPNDEKKTENYLLPCCVQVFGPQIWMVRHLANDWLAGTWFFLWISAVFAVGSFGYFCVAVSNKNASEKNVFVFTAGFLDAVMFLIGSLYFVSGSYPHASQFYYAINQGPATSKQVEKREIKKFERKTAAVQLKLGQSTSGKMGGPLGTMSQNMDLRLDVTINPLLEQNVMSSAGTAKPTGAAVALEIKDKLQTTVEVLSKRGSIYTKPSNISTITPKNKSKADLTALDVEEGPNVPIVENDIGLVVELDPNQDDDDIEIDEDHEPVNILNPLHMMSASAKANEPKPVIRNG